MSPSAGSPAIAPGPQGRKLTRFAFPRRVGRKRWHMRPSRLSAWMLLPLVLIVQGCTVGPKYKRPEVHTDASFQNAAVGQFTQDQTRINWWSIFNDPQLSQLIQDAAAANH